MRISGGLYRGREIDTPGTHQTHPMSERARTALFNVLGDIDGLRVADLFSGGGTMAIEALSRGASYVIAVEQDRLAEQTIRRNIANLKIGNELEVAYLPVSHWLRLQKGELFSVVICDPPYNSLQTETLDSIADLLTPDGVLALSWPDTESAPPVPGMKLVKSSKQSHASLHFYLID